jgi:hypothetical protein
MSPNYSTNLQFPKPITEIDLFGNQSFIIYSPKPMPNRWKRLWHKAVFGTIYKPQSK